MEDKELYNVYKEGWMRGFNWGMLLMGLFSIFVFLMIWFAGGFKI
jgi:hypothetical protein